MLASEGFEEELRSVVSSQKRVEAGLAELTAAQRRVEEVVQEFRQDLLNLPPSSQPPFRHPPPGTLSTLPEHAAAEPNEATEGEYWSESQPDLEPHRRKGNHTTVFSLTAQRELHSITSPGSTFQAPGCGCSDLPVDTPLSLPEGWPKTLQARVFSDALVSGSVRDVLTIHNDTRSTAAFVWDVNALERVYSEPNSRPSYWAGVRDPSSRLHLSLAFLGLLFLVHDLTVIPFALAWQLDFAGYLKWSTICSVTFWSFDVLVNFCKGFHSGGDLILNPGAIAKRYLKTWFLPDIGMISCDWVGIMLELAFGNGGDSARGLKMLRFARLGRLLRIAGVVRMLRVFHSLSEVMDEILSDDLRFTLRGVGLAACALWFTHLVACAWFAVGFFGYTDTGNRWVYTDVDYHGETVEFTVTSYLYQYLTAYHWSLAQVSLGAIEIPCENSVERLFNISCLIIGLFGGSALVSLLSANMVEFQSRKRDRTEMLRTLRRYLADNLVEARLASRVVRQVTERLHRRIQITEEAVSVLEIMSRSLRGELHVNIVTPHLTSHPLFSCWSITDRLWLDRFCNQVIGMATLRIDDDMFRNNSEASAAYMVVTGHLCYSQRPDSSTVMETTEAKVEKGSWLCESVLWCEWVHVGTAVAVTPCKVLTLNAESFVEEVQKNPQINLLAASYGKEYHRRVVSARPPFAPWPTDIYVPFTEYDDIVTSMSKTAVAYIGMQALSRMGHARWRTTSPSRRSQVDKLTQEVMQGKSAVIQDHTGKVFRIVSVVALHLERDDGYLFAQIGKLSEKGLWAACELPGSKREHGELVEDAIDRLLTTKLEPLQKCVEIEHLTATTLEKLSAEYNVLTRYRRTVCCATLSDEFDAPLCTLRRGDCYWSGHCVQANSSIGPSNSSTYTATSSIGSLAHRPAPEAPHAHIAARLRIADVFFLKHPRQAYGGIFCAWLDPGDFEHLQTNSGQAILKAWLEAQEVPQAALVTPSLHEDEDFASSDSVDSDTQSV